MRDSISPAMKVSIEETERRRKIQDAYNKEHGITPKTIKKSVRDVIEATKAAEDEEPVQRQESAGTDEERAERICKETGKRNEAGCRRSAV